MAHSMDSGIIFQIGGKVAATYKKHEGVTSIGDLSISCGDGRILIAGSLDITKDREGLTKAGTLKLEVDHINDEIQRKNLFCPWGVRTSTSPLTPFANEKDVCSIGGLTIENRIDRVSIYGSLDVSGNLAGQAMVTALKGLVDSVTTSLLNAKNLPDKVVVDEVTEVRNPFASGA